MARFLNTLPEGDLTGSAYDPRGASFAQRANSTIGNILQFVEGERQRRRNRAIVDAILNGGGFPGQGGGIPGEGGGMKYPPGVTPFVPDGASTPMIRQVVPGPMGGQIAGMMENPNMPAAVDPNAQAAPRAQSALGRIIKGVGGMFDPTAVPNNATDLEEKLALQTIQNQGRQVRYQNVNKPPSDFQIWQQAQKEVLAEAGGSALAGVSDPKQRELLRQKTIERFNALKSQFSGQTGAGQAAGAGTGTGGGGSSAAPAGGYKEGTEAYNPRTGEKIKLINGKWVPIK